MAKIINEVEQLEQRKDSLYLSISVFGCHTWLDLPDVGPSIVVVTDGDALLAEKTAKELAKQLWAVRREFYIPLPSPREAVDMALADREFPVIIADSSDAVSSGAPGDNTALLSALLERADDLKGLALVPVVDPEAVAKAVQHRVGEAIELELGGKATPRSGSPIRVSGTLLTVSHGTFMSELSAVPIKRGITIVVAVGKVHIVISERPASTWSPAFYSSLGYDPGEAQIVVVKTPQGFKIEYASIAKTILITNSHGIADPDVKSLPWKRIKRPIFPLDEYVDLEDYSNEVRP